MFENYKQKKVFSTIPRIFLSYTTSSNIICGLIHGIHFTNKGGGVLSTRKGLNFKFSSVEINTKRQFKFIDFLYSLMKIFFYLSIRIHRFSYDFLSNISVMIGILNCSCRIVSSNL